MKLSYLDFLNRFWRLNAAKSFSAVDTRLYMYLLQQFNLHRWPDSVEVPTRKLEHALGISRKQIQTAKRRLEQRGLITFTVGNRSKSPVYTLHCGQNETETYTTTCISTDNKTCAKSAENGNEMGNIKEPQSGNIIEYVSDSESEESGTLIDKGDEKVPERVAGNLVGHTDTPSTGNHTGTQNGTQTVTPNKNKTKTKKKYFLENPLSRVKETHTPSPAEKIKIYRHSATEQAYRNFLIPIPHPPKLVPKRLRRLIGTLRFTIRCNHLVSRHRA